MPDRFYEAGWSDNPLERYEGLDEVQAMFPEVFGGVPLTVRDFNDAVTYVNSEGNYNEFIFRAVATR